LASKHGTGRALGDCWLNESLKSTAEGANFRPTRATKSWVLGSAQPTGPGHLMGSTTYRAKNSKILIQSVLDNLKRRVSTGMIWGRNSEVSFHTNKLNALIESWKFCTGIKPCCIFFLWGAQGWLLVHGHAYLASSARLPWICGWGLGPWVLSGQGLLCQNHLPSVGENFLDSTG